MPPPSTEELIEVRPSGVHGLGAFARRTLRTGEVLGVYEGRRYAPEDVLERDWDNALTYVFGLTDGTVIDGSDGGNATRHINHSCAPNCVAFEVEGEDGHTQIVIEARRRIRAGEELFIDYALEVADGDAEAYVCHCGQRGCRGTLVGA